MEKCVFVKKHISCRHGMVTLERKGTGITGISACIRVRVWFCENSALTTALSHIIEPREVCGSSGCQVRYSSQQRKVR